jgi:hypothetical protein
MMVVTRCDGGVSAVSLPTRALPPFFTPFYADVGIIAEECFLNVVKLIGKLVVA